MNDRDSEIASMASSRATKKRTPKYIKPTQKLIETLLNKISEVISSKDDNQEKLDELGNYLKTEYDKILPPDSQEPAIFSELLLTTISTFKNPTESIKLLSKLAVDQNILDRKEHKRVYKALIVKEIGFDTEKLKSFKFTPTPLKPSGKFTLEQYDAFLERLVKEQDEEVAKIEQEKIMPVFEQFIAIMDQVDFKSMGLNDITFSIFGSFVNNFGTSGGDIDVSLNTHNYVDERALLKLIYECYLQELDKEDELKISLHNGNGIRIPLIKFEFVKYEFSLDLCVNNLLGVINSKLLYVYSIVDDRCEKLGKLVKIWAKNNKICSGQNAISSYGFLLMMINYLQMVDPPVLPSLQELNSDKREPAYLRIKRVFENGFKFDDELRLDFETDLESIGKAFPKRNKMGLWELLTGFFEFFSKVYPEIKATLSIKHGQMIPRKGWSHKLKKYSNKNAESFYISIEDPFDVHDPGRNISTGNESVIKEKIEKTYQVMSEFNKTFVEVFTNST